MKTIRCKLLAALLCVAVLCGCAADNTPDYENADNTNIETGTQNTDAPSDTTAPDDTTTVPDESGASDSESEDAQNNTLTSEELAQWESYFNTMENNGLLRFPYADLANDPAQLAPYLPWLFYDIGEYESTFTDEEIALLSDAGLWLELDSFRLTRTFITSYLADKLGLSAQAADLILSTAQLGIYLDEYDAWYIAHGDTAYNPYTFKSGTRLEDGTVKLCYSNDFLAIAQENGEEDYIDAEMIVTLAQHEDGTWYVVSHEINRSAWDE